MHFNQVVLHAVESFHRIATLHLAAHGCFDLSEIFKATLCDPESLSPSRKFLSRC